MILPIVLFLLLLIAPDVYLWTEYIRQQDSWWLNVFWFMPSVAAVASFILVNRGVYHNTFIRVMFALVLCFGLPKLVFALLQFFVSWQLAIVLPISIQIALIYGFFFGWRRIVVRSSTCVSKLLPKSFDGYKVLQFSDLHLGTFRHNPAFIKKLVRVINEQRVDLIVFTGDLVNIHAEEVRPFMSDLQQITAPDGVYSIMGNHDYCEYGMDATREKMEKSAKPNKLSKAARNQRVLEYLQTKIGWRMLMNEHVNIVRVRSDEGANKSESISIIGVENIGSPPFKSMGNLSKAMEGLVDGTFKILLSHDPTHWRRGVLHKTDIALTLSGHTHAGQLKIGKFSPAKWAYNEWGGKYVEGESMLYVSLGVGGTLPFRFGAWPEINVITLLSK